MSTTSLSPRRADKWFRPLLAVSLGLACLILYAWAEFLEVFPGLGGLGRLVVPLFWLAHAAWFASIFAMFKIFGRRGAWSLLGGVALLPAPLLGITLTVGCYVFGECV